jgi:Fe-S-cluster containining protein
MRKHVEFTPVPFERFEAFHRAFDGEANGMWNICAQCGGKCEQHKIGSLMPGEKAYIAHQLGLDVPTFEARYLDQVVTPRGDIDVLKLVPGCPFLDACFHCTLADKKVKPVLCEIYPVVAEVHLLTQPEGQPALEVEFLVDEVDCPLLHLTYSWSKRQVSNPRWQEYRTYFATQGIERLRQVGAPAEWYWAVEQYDSENFDYEALRRKRKVPPDQYDTFTLDELMSCSLGHDL